MLVATSQGQRDHDDDYCFTIDGELVSMPFGPCPDELCDCTPSAFGLSSSRGTTTVTVADVPDLTEDTYLDAFRDAMERMGWLPALETDDLEPWVRWHIDLAAAVPDGAVARARMTADGKIVLQINSRTL